MISGNCSAPIFVEFKKKLMIGGKFCGDETY
jgi:hypothetical protein